MNLLTSSRMRAFRDCPRLHRYLYVEGWRPVRDSEALRFGTLFHLGLEAWWLAHQAGAAGEAPLPRYPWPRRRARLGFGVSPRRGAPKPRAGHRVARPGEAMAEPDLKAVKEYIWAKYVDFTRPPSEIDEDAAMKVLEEHFRATPIAADGENYYRGIPQTIRFADNTQLTATVNSIGRVASTTDELGNTSSYGYDALGRLTSVTYPAADTTAWHPTSISYTQVATPEYGIPSGHWRRAESTGNLRRRAVYPEPFGQRAGRVQCGIARPAVADGDVHAGVLQQVHGIRRRIQTQLILRVGLVKAPQPGHEPQRR